MNFKDIQVSPELFFRVGMWCFLLIGIFNILNYFYLAGSHNIFSTLSSWIYIVFNFILALFFRYLYNQQVPQVSEDFASDDVEEIIKTLKREKKESVNEQKKPSAPIGQTELPAKTIKEKQKGKRRSYKQTQAEN